MITSVKNIVKPRNILLAGMFALGVVTSANTLKAQVNQQMPSNVVNVLEGPSTDIFEFTTEDNTVVKFSKQDDLKTVKKQFKTLMQSIMVENPWKLRTSGINNDEYVAILAFLNEAYTSKDLKVSAWADKKIKELEQLRDSEYNTKTKKAELEKSQKLIDKYDKEVQKLQSGISGVRSFFDYLLYKDDYQRMYDRNSELLKFAERDRAYYKALNLSQQFDELSTAAVKKFVKGNAGNIK